ncbi:MAG: dihydrolipoyl dehydrogenase [Thermodesulfobacteriota bacterium]|jgi:dihydrolipoamide dehydrogenase
MKKYDVIAIGSGSATNILDSIIQRDPQIKIALIDKDDPGGICLTRGCIPSKMLLYPAELIRTVERGSQFGIEVEVKRVDFLKVMERMRTSISRDVEEIRKGLSHHPSIDYYPEAAEFLAPYTLKVGGNKIKADVILLCTGSKPLIPPVKGLAEVGYVTSDTLLKMTELPESIAILGGGYIAAEYGHFFSAMGAKVTIIGRNPQFLPNEEPEVSTLAKKEMSKYMTILTDQEVVEVKKMDGERKGVVARDKGRGKEMNLTAQEILVASGRSPNTDILHPERAGIKIDKDGWFEVNEYLETSQPNIWAFGDANGKSPFKHKANYESMLVFNNAVLGRKVKVDYHAIPHAIFSYPEIAAVGLKEKEALARYGEERVLIGLQRFEETGKGQAMGLKDFFVKVILQEGNQKILGAHIIGPQASILIQEIITLMYTPAQDSSPIAEGMHIHPALSEVVERAFESRMSPAHYHHVLMDSLRLGK